MIVVCVNVVGRVVRVVVSLFRSCVRVSVCISLCVGCVCCLFVVFSCCLCLFRSVVMFV